MLLFFFYFLFLSFYKYYTENYINVLIRQIITKSVLFFFFLSKSNACCFIQIQYGNTLYIINIIINKNWTVYICTFAHCTGHIYWNILQNRYMSTFTSNQDILFSYLVHSVNFRITFILRSYSAVFAFTVNILSSNSTISTNLHI